MVQPVGVQDCSSPGTVNTGISGLKPSQSKQGKKDRESNSQRLRELRQFDQKLRKREEELTIREAKCSDLEKEFQH